MLTKVILLFTAGVLAGANYGGERMILPVLLTLTVLALNEYFRNRLVAGVLYILMLLLPLLLPTQLLFLPLCTYDLLYRDRYSLAAALVLVPAAIILPRSGVLLAFSFLLICVLTVFLRVLRERMYRDEVTLRRQRDDFTERQRLLEQRLQDTIGELIAGQETAQRDERIRIAREIHDGVGHRLSSALLQVGALQVVNQAPALTDNLDALQETLSDAMNAIRTSVHDLRDRSMSLYDSLYALRGSLGGCEISLRYELTDTPSPAHSRAILAIVQEALANVMRHSDASAVEIVVCEHPALYQIIISDNGTRPPSAQFQCGNGMGLENIRARAAAFHGAADFRYDGGFRVFASLRREQREERQTQ